jgi:hypothetical protein
MQWARAPQSREQMVLFVECLDDVLPPDHTVRLLDEILSRINWTPWEAADHERRGQPAIRPRVLAGVARLDAAGQKSPSRLPLTDPQSRVMPDNASG